MHQTSDPFLLASDATLALTGAIARGDTEALGVFYERWFDRAYAAARGLTGRDEAFCLDVVQDAMLRVVGSIRPLATEGDLERWLTRVVTTAALDRLRREARRVRREGDRARASEVVSDAAGAAQLTEQVVWLRARLAELPADDRALLGLRFARGRTLEGAGGCGGLSGDAAHGRIRRALDRLRASAREIFS